VNSNVAVVPLRLPLGPLVMVVSGGVVSKLEANRSEPHPRTIRKLAKALGVEPSELAPK
jgi:transcriptional regulator with XRE-family HTH domain